MDEELDLIELEGEDGSQLTCEILDYFFYEGDEYAIMRPYDENAECDKDCSECEGCEDLFAMKVVPEGDDSEVFEPVSEELSEKLIDILMSDPDEEFEDEE